MWAAAADSKAPARIKREKKKRSINRPPRWRQSKRRGCACALCERQAHQPGEAVCSRARRGARDDEKKNIAKKARAFPPIRAEQGSMRCENERSTACRSYASGRCGSLARSTWVPPFAGRAFLAVRIAAASLAPFCGVLSFFFLRRRRLLLRDQQVRGGRKRGRVCINWVAMGGTGAGERSAQRACTLSGGCTQGIAHWCSPLCSLRFSQRQSGCEARPADFARPRSRASVSSSASCFAVINRPRQALLGP